MKVEKEIIDRKYVLFIDGVEHHIKSAARILGLKDTQVRHLCNTVKKADFDTKIKEIQWREKNGIGRREKIWTVQGERVTIKQVASFVGVNDVTASDRIKLAIKNNRSLDWVFRPASAKRIKAGKESREKKNKNKELENLPPRKNLSDIPSPGSWERNHLK
jgi:hypothetical protein